MAASTVRLDFFYGTEGKQCSFYRVPKVFEKDEQYRQVSLEIKYLYCIMLDRVSVSTKNQWKIDGHIFIYFTLEEVIRCINVGRSKAVRIMREMERLGLIERKKQGQGKPARIFVKNFIVEEQETPAVPDTYLSGEHFSADNTAADPAFASHADTEPNVAESAAAVTVPADSVVVESSAAVPSGVESADVESAVTNPSAAETLPSPDWKVTPFQSDFSTPAQTAEEEAPAEAGSAVSYSTAFSSMMEERLIDAEEKDYPDDAGELGEMMSAVTDESADSPVVPDDVSPENVSLSDLFRMDATTLFKAGVSRLSLEPGDLEKIEERLPLKEGEAWNDSRADCDPLATAEQMGYVLAAAYARGQDNAPDSRDATEESSSSFQSRGIKTGPQRSQNQTSRSLKSEPLEVPRQDPNYIKGNNIDFNKHQSIYPASGSSTEKRNRRIEWMDMSHCRETIRFNIDYDLLCAQHPDDIRQINEYVELMAEACCSSQPTIRVNCQNYPVGLVRRRFESLNQAHILYVLECMREHAGEVRNIRAYTLTALFNAFTTIETYYDTKIARDAKDPNWYNVPKQEMA